MSGLDAMRAELSAGMDTAKTALAAADRLCEACVVVLEVDGASVSLIHDGATQGTFGSSGELSRHLDELQFTFGEGPCLDSVRGGRPILVADLDDPAEQRWPAFRGAVLDAGMGSVFALPVAVANRPVGALDLFRSKTGPLGGGQFGGAMHAAELAALPLLDLMSSDVDWETAGQGADGWDQLSSLERVEVYQATGMIMAAAAVGPADALVRLRAYAFAHETTASEVAFAIVERRLRLEPPDWPTDASGPPGPRPARRPGGLGGLGPGGR